MRSRNCFAARLTWSRILRHPNGCLLVQGALASGPLAEPVRKELSRTRAGAEMLVRKRLERAIAEGDLPKSADPTKLARFMISVIWGMSVQASGGYTREQLHEVAEMAMRCLP